MSILDVKETKYVYIYVDMTIAICIFVGSCEVKDGGTLFKQLSHCERNKQRTKGCASLVL
jgi:hypothetical protein